MYTIPAKKHTATAFLIPSTPSAPRATTATAVHASRGLVMLSPGKPNLGKGTCLYQSINICGTHASVYCVCVVNANINNEPPRQIQN